LPSFPAWLVRKRNAGFTQWGNGDGRRVFLVFTLRRKGDKQLIRPISARYMHKKEIESYEKENPGV
jgi:uncharacterized DUF497 family protein